MSPEHILLALLVGAAFTQRWPDHAHPAVVAFVAMLPADSYDRAWDVLEERQGSRPTAAPRRRTCLAGAST
jgi:hypothetical protein